MVFGADWCLDLGFDLIVSMHTVCLPSLLFMDFRKFPLLDFTTACLRVGDVGDVHCKKHMDIEL